MAKDVSVAPRERVNIRYKPATGDNREGVELPLKLLVLGDYSMRGDDRPVEDRQLTSIGKDNFDQVMEGHDLSLDIQVDNRLAERAGGDEQLSLSLKFKTLKDFSPEAIVRQSPELSSLLELREALVALKGPLGNVPAFRKAIQGVVADEALRDRLVAELVGPAAAVDEPSQP